MIVIRSGRHPIVVMVLAACVIGSVNNLVNFDRASSNLVRLLPTSFGYAFYALLAVGAAISLVGVFWRGLDGLLIERAGYLILAGQWVAFGALLTTAGWRGVWFALLLLAFAGGAVWRIAQIRRDLKDSAHRESTGVPRSSGG
jgi:hypothetical protein